MLCKYLITAALFYGAAHAAPAADSWAEEAEVDPRPFELLNEELSRAKAGLLRADEALVNNELAVQLDAVHPIIDLTESDDDFLVMFTVFNPSEKEVKFSTRDTPLEGMMQQNAFDIRNPRGELMKYRGKDVKRTEQPAEEEYLTLAPGQSKSSRVRISRRYQLEGDGLYYIRVKQPMDSHIIYTDVMRTTVKVMVSGTAEHEKRNDERQAARDAEAKQMLLEGGAGFTYQGCSSAQQTELQGWHADATHKIASALACTESSCSTLVDTWFGSGTAQSNFMAVTEEFTRMQNVKDNSIYVCQGNQGPCAGGSTFAYVYPTDTSQRIYMCDFTFNYPDYSEKVQTVIHELSHFNHIGDTNDNAYGERTCINLAQSNFQSALQTADNTGYFGKYANTCYRHGPSGYVAANAPTVGCTDQYSNCASLASNGCSGSVSGGQSIGTVCCRSCQGSPSNDCTGVGNGGSSSGGSSSGGSSSSRRRATPPSPPASSGGGSSSAQDTASNCPALVSQHGCDACCISSTGGNVATVCASTCASSGSSPAPQPTRSPTRSPTTPPVSSLRRRRTSSGSGSSGGTCRWEGDGMCDVPQFCPAGTDQADCA